MISKVMIREENNQKGTLKGVNLYPRDSRNGLTVSTMGVSGVSSTMKKASPPALSGSWQRVSNA